MKVIKEDKNMIQWSDVYDHTEEPGVNGRVDEIFSNIAHSLYIYWQNADRLDYGKVLPVDLHTGHFVNGGEYLEQGYACDTSKYKTVKILPFEVMRAMRFICTMFYNDELTLDIDYAAKNIEYEEIGDLLVSTIIIKPLTISQELLDRGCEPYRITELIRHRNLY